ncbi:sigma 54-interacting transcriptional regulator [Pseudobacter ginsenosidimutans]|uniref:Transcriptional regulator with GAF, ATPase, and Fis domain n=1 Tax=Pseudobacter ginsenosidimutans TaxID=661488 RepID=A0A4Q7ML70_9BACT|nr:sigma 54-interacting transcriptional regulator [Pseudobacter ginsenosidimutans]QEC40292.1 AAA family ATPase [Pseudobacter ginsenosidimutans]RZS69105.1 transcriptional regulator with GAF, ATPase, and Fis domain [Pseudobacter ginsenosidimutans]
MKKAKSLSPELPIPSVLTLEQERQVLLDLGNDITRVRDKNDLLILFSKRIKSLFYFTHTIVTLIEAKDETYTPFLLDNTSSPIRTHARYQEMVDFHFSLNDPWIQSVLEADGPISFLLEEVMDLPQSPAFLRVNHSAGVKEILMTKIMNKEKPMGFIHIYSDRDNSFTDEFRSIIKGITPQLSSAIANIIRNEEILDKEKEKSFLLDFCSEIAMVRTREQLANAVHTALYKLNAQRGYVIRKINEDGETLSAYIYDQQLAQSGNADLEEMISTSFPINDGLQNRVLDSYIPLLFSVEREIQRGISSSYLHFWKKIGHKTIVGIRLHQGETNLGILWLGIDEINIQLLQGICSQISIAMANIMANEQIVNTQQEQAFLLDFSKDIALVKTKPELETAIFRVFDKIMHTKLAMIRVFDEDGIHLRPFMFDRTLFENAGILFDELSNHLITSDEPYTAKVLASTEGVMFNVEEEINSGNTYAKLWQTTGLRNMHSLPLVAGDKIIGTIWLLADWLSQLVLKGICAQISVAIANILANEKLLAYKKQLEQENLYLKEQIRNIYNFSEIIGNAAAMQDVYRLMSLVADSGTTVLVLGETGTGKELIARALHNASPRKEKLMIKVNCAALPANLIESELFGHERGAFTGAIDRRIGKFELANHSTLFLDEIGELPLEAQAKLLRVIQERELERLGGKQTIKIDVRLIAATNRNLEEEVKAGRFRADLYFRLNVFPIVLPPLRDRMEDIEPLTHFFIEKFSKNTGRRIRKVAPKVLQQLRAYTWPGNVRELEHLIERSVLLTTDGQLRDVFIPKHNGADKPELAQIANLPLEEIERGYIIEVLKRCSGKISGAGGAAEILKVPGNTLHSKMKKLKITKADYFA